MQAVILVLSIALVCLSATAMLITEDFKVTESSDLVVEFLMTIASGDATLRQRSKMKTSHLANLMHEVDYNGKLSSTDCSIHVGSCCVRPRVSPGQRAVHETARHQGDRSVLLPPTPLVPDPPSRRRRGHHSASYCSSHISA